MWYFTWVLGLSAALMFGVLNGMWLEFQLARTGDDGDDSAEHSAHR